MIRYETTYWPDSRKCGYIHKSSYDTSDKRWQYVMAGKSDSIASVNYSTYERRCNCTIKYGPAGTGKFINWYVAICASRTSNNWKDGDGSVNNWLATNSYTCPKGWGKLNWRYPNDSYSVQFSRGYIKSGTGVPVYGYVTRYRTACYNYITARVSKA